MALSYTAYTGDGVLTEFPISFNYIDKAHIEVTVEGSAVSFTVDTINKVVRLSTAPVVGSRVLITRKTPITHPYSDFTRGNAFGQSNVNNSFLWQLMISQEIAEGRHELGHVMLENLNMGDNRVINAKDAEDAKDLPTYGQVAKMIEAALPDPLPVWVHTSEWSTDPYLTDANQLIPYAGTNQLFRPLSLPYQVDSTAHPDPNALLPNPATGYQGELADVSTFVTEEDLSDLETEVNGVKSDVSTLQGSSSAMQGDIADLTDDLDVLAKKGKDSYFNSRSYVKNRQHKGYTFIGDSITSGTYDNVSWCEKIVFGLAKKWETKNIAFRSLQESDKTTIHDVTFDANWSQVHPFPSSIFGSACTSSTVNAEITVNPTYPTYGLRVGYIHDGSDFSFSIEQEDGRSLTVNAVAGARKNLISNLFVTERSLKPIKIKVLSGTVQLTGVEYVDSFDEPTSLVLARGGRSINDTDTATLTEIESMSSGTIVFSLGYNDKNNANTAQRADIIAKVQHLITLATASNREILINDFMWDVDETHWLRSAYIDFEKNNANVTLLRHPSRIVEGLQSTTNTYRIDTLGTFRDSAHPNGNGYEWLAGVVRKVIGCEDGEDYRKSLLPPDYQVTGTGNPVSYRHFVESSSLSEVGNKTGKLVIKLPVTPVSDQFFWEFKLSIFTFPANKVGEIAMYCYKDGDDFSVLNYDVRDVTGLTGLTIAEATLDGNIAISIGDNTTVWGYPTAHISESKVSFYSGNDIIDEVTLSVTTNAV